MHPSMYQRRKSASVKFGYEQEFGGLFNPSVMSIDDGSEEGTEGGGGENEETPPENQEEETPPAPDGDGEGKPKPTDAEAKLLKEQMKTKGELKKARDAAKAAQDALKAYEGVDVEEFKRLKQAQADAERAELEKRGEYDRVLAQVREQNEAALSAKDQELSVKDQELAKAQAQIDELTIGSAFANSTFLREETVLTPTKARKLYGEHVERVEGEIVVYDKPKGAANRTPLVDANGDNLPFEEAIAKIVKADEDFERFQRSKLKPGSGSTGAQHKEEEAPPTQAKGVNRLAANLGKLREAAKSK